MNKTPLETAIEAVGSAKALAEKVGVTPMAITQWKARGVPAHRVRSVVEACGGVVTAHQLRPDIFHEDLSRKPDSDLPPPKRAA